MIFLSQAQIDALLLEDIQGGDLTTRALNIGHQHGYIEFFHRQGGCVSGISVACKMLTTLGLTIDDAVSDGSQANAGQRLIRAQGNAAVEVIFECCQINSAGQSQRAVGSQRRCYLRNFSCLLWTKFVELKYVWLRA